MSDRRPVVVLVHGFLGTPHDWDPMRSALGAAGAMDVRAVDLLACARDPECASALARAAHLDPGALVDADDAARMAIGGREHADAGTAASAARAASGAACGEPDGLDALASALSAHLDGAAREGRQVILCGYSLGGRVCLALAAQLHMPVTCIVIGADPGIEDPRERSLRAGRDHAHATHLMQDPDAFIASWYAQPLFASLRTSPDFDAVLSRRRESLADAASRTGWALILDACSPGRCAPRWGVAARLGHRLAVMHGALDDKFAAIARRIHACAPQVPTISIPGAGHAAHVEQPGACAGAVSSIIAASLPKDL
jgi:2-succinyl-6-hydroxy-2,4-cyclohexadiene-1-carboxylate synthase